jgi:hypothetical protein
MQMHSAEGVEEEVALKMPREEGAVFPMLAIERSTPGIKIFQAIGSMWIKAEKI